MTNSQNVIIIAWWPGSRQHSGQTSGVREGVNSGRPRAIFPRNIPKENIIKVLCEQTRELTIDFLDYV